MPLYKHIRDDIEKLSYIEKVEFKNARLYMYYTSDDKMKVKMLPFRSSKDQLLKALEFIRKDGDYYIREAERLARGEYNVKPKNMVAVSSVEG